jgi:polysaccharide pyruvyl transferase WcaK-like protein
MPSPSRSNSRTSTSSEAPISSRNDKKAPKLAFFGHFGMNNFGNETTLQAFLCNLQQLLPQAGMTCICTDPVTTAEEHKMTAIPMARPVWSLWSDRDTPVIKSLRRLFVTAPLELCDWLRALLTLRHKHALIIPGTGLLTDAHGLQNWGPYTVFKWSLAAKLCRCKLLIVSVGAGPLYGRLGRWLVKAALAMADFRSYRDASTMDYLDAIGFHRDSDLVYPDLVFSLAESALPHLSTKRKDRTVVGVGIMQDSGRYSSATPSSASYQQYLETLASFVEWLLAHDYDVRLLIGDQCDEPVLKHFATMLSEHQGIGRQGRLSSRSISCAADLLLQMAGTDLVVATRFHNLVFAALLNKPLITISVHHKCRSLMQQIDLAEYCCDISDVRLTQLIEMFCKLEANASRVKEVMRQKVGEYRRALDEQYGAILRCVGVS